MSSRLRRPAVITCQDFALSPLRQRETLQRGVSLALRESNGMSETVVSAIAHRRVSSLSAQRVPSRTSPSWVPKLIAFTPEAPGSDHNKAVRDLRDCRAPKLRCWSFSQHTAPACAHSFARYFVFKGDLCEHVCQQPIVAASAIIANVRARGHGEEQCKSAY